MTKIDTFLIHYGEIGLKGENRGDFEKALERDLIYKISDITENAKFETHNKYFTLEIPSDSALNDNEKIINRIKRVFGVKWFAQVQEFDRQTPLQKINEEIIKRARNQAAPDKTFKIDCKRADKRFPKTSQEIEVKIGAQIIQNTEYKKVDLSNPDDTYFVEITHSQIFIFEEKIDGPGGLPVGASGRMLTLLSGGIDSPVAAYLMAKRGCQIDFLHFYVKKPGKDDKIPRLAKQVAKFTGRGRLFLLPYLPFNMKLLDIDTMYELVLFRRFMFKATEQVISEKDHKALVTGDNLGQVASQTIENLTAADDILENNTCLRPLIGYDKFEIIQIAKQIDTFKISNEAHKDCCSIVDRHAKTKVTLKRIGEEESKIKDYSNLLENTLEELDYIDIEPY
jgi:thiamine biosynthesis protein ThiI